MRLLRSRQVALAQWIVLLVLASTLSSKAEADETDALTATLEEPIVATASKSPTSERLAPSTSMTVTGEELRTYGIRFLSEAIELLSAGLFSSDPLHQAEFGARGVHLNADYNNHVLVLLDGHTMNEFSGGTVLIDEGAGIPVESIDHIELVAGPGSVLYGANAMLGVINVVTKQAKDHEGVHLTAELGTLSPSARDRSIDGSGIWAKTGHGSVGYGHELTLFGTPASVLVQLDYYGHTSPSIDFPVQPAAYDHGPRAAPGTWGGVMKRQYWSSAPSSIVKLSLGDFVATFQGSSFERSTPYITYNQPYSDFDSPTNGEADRVLRADLKHRKVLSPRVALSNRLYGDVYEYEQNIFQSGLDLCLAGQPNGCDAKYLAVARWLGLESQLGYDILPNGRLSVLAGIDGRYRYSKGQLDVADLVTRYNPGPVFSVENRSGAGGAYVQVAAQPLGWFGVNAGIRGDQDPRYGSHLSPRATLLFDTAHKTTFKAVYSEAFRGPTDYELGISSPLYLVLADNLRPEVVRSTEGSIEQRVGLHRFGVVGFHSTWDNLVTLAALTPEEINSAIGAGQLAPGTISAQQYRNIAALRNYGYTLRYSGSTLGGGVRFGASVTEAYARQAEAGGASEQPVPVAPAVFGNTHAAVALGPKAPTLALAATFQGSQFADRAFDPVFSQSVRVLPQLKLRGTVSGPFVPVPGLSYRLSVQYAFSGDNAYVTNVTPPAPMFLSPELAPAIRLSGFVGLQYDLGD